MSSLFVWCLTGASCVFDGKRVLMMSYSCGAPHVVDG